MTSTTGGLPARMMPVLLPALLALLGCTPDPPTISSVLPDAVQPGDTVSIQADKIDDDTVLHLVLGDDDRILPVTRDGLDPLQVDVPTDFPPGIWSVALEGPGGRSTTPVTLEVWTADTEAPCVKRYALSTETSRTQRKIAFDRIYLDRPSTRHAFLGDQLGHLELSTTTVPEGTCWGLWLHDDTGTRWLIADDTRDLTKQAQQIASVLEIDLVR